MSGDDWASVQKALFDKFSGGPDNVLGGERYAQVLDEERAYGEAIVDFFHGYDCLEHAFFEFFIETLELAGEHALFGQLPKEDKHYSVLYLNFLREFRSLRAAATLKNYGYPMKGFALLRDLKDQAIACGAVVNGLTDVLALRGFTEDTIAKEKMEKADFKKLSDEAKSDRARVIKLMVGEDSGLDTHDIEVLVKWRDMFHQEVHGAFLSYIDDMKTLFQKKQLPDFGPRPHDNDFDISMYINRATEIGWMIMRTMPYLQLRPNAFGKEWKEKWMLLDDAFRLQVQDLADLGKEIGEVFLRMIDAKFNFSPKTYYPTHND